MIVSSSLNQVGEEAQGSCMVSEQVAVTWADDRLPSADVRIPCGVFQECAGIPALSSLPFLVFSELQKGFFLHCPQLKSLLTQRIPHRASVWEFRASWAIN